MVIGFGRTYVQSKMNCLGYQLTIYELSKSAADSLQVKVENIGTKSIDLETDQYFAFVMAMNDGSVKTCALGDTAPANGCIIQKVPGETLDPGEMMTLTIKLGTSLSVDNVISGHFKYGLCGAISGEAFKIQ